MINGKIRSVPLNISSSVGKYNMFYFRQFYPIFSQKSRHNSRSLLKFRSLGRTKADRLQCFHFMNDSHIVFFFNLVRDQCDVTHWAGVGDAKMSDFNFTSLVGYDFQGRISDLSRDLSKECMSKVNIFNLPCFTYFTVSTTDKA